MGTLWDRNACCCLAHMSALTYGSLHVVLAQELYRWQSVAEAGRQAIGMRYRLLPHLYTAFHRAQTVGTPVAKPLWFAYPSDPATHGIDDQWLLGDLLITPIIHQVGLLKACMSKGCYSAML